MHGDDVCFVGLLRCVRRVWQLRAKNFEALLLLGTAFIILLSQTFAGYWLTSWLPADPQQNALAWLRMENLKS